MWSSRSLVLPAIAVACALALASCARKDATAGNPLPIIVAEDAVRCQVLDEEVACAAIPEHLLTKLQTPTSKLIILSDRKAGRTDDAVTKLVEELRKAGYSKVMVSGFISERL